MFPCKFFSALYTVSALNRANFELLHTEYDRVSSIYLMTFCGPVLSNYYKYCVRGVEYMLYTYLLVCIKTPVYQSFDCISFIHAAAYTQYLCIIVVYVPCGWCNLCKAFFIDEFSFS